MRKLSFLNLTVNMMNFEDFKRNDLLNVKICVFNIF